MKCCGQIEPNPDVRGVRSNLWILRAVRFGACRGLDASSGYLASRLGRSIDICVDVTGRSRIILIDKKRGKSVL